MKIIYVKKFVLVNKFSSSARYDSLKKQFYEKVNKFWLVTYEIEQAPTYEKSHSEATHIFEVVQFPKYSTYYNALFFMLDT